MATTLRYDATSKAIGRKESERKGAADRRASHLLTYASLYLICIPICEGAKIQIVNSESGQPGTRMKRETYNTSSRTPTKAAATSQCRLIAVSSHVLFTKWPRAISTLLTAHSLSHSLLLSLSPRARYFARRNERWPLSCHLGMKWWCVTPSAVTSGAGISAVS